MDRVETARIRLYVEHPLGPEQIVRLDRAQAHYLFGVMRLDRDRRLLLFDGATGEWLAEVVEARKRDGLLRVLEQTRPMQPPPDVCLYFAPVKKTRTDFIVEKAAEMGVSRIVPVQTAFTNAGRIQRERLQAHAIEAAEQCGATFVPEVAGMQRFDAVLRDWDVGRQIMFCDETRAGAASQLPADIGPWAIWVGPEGGFSEAERERFSGIGCAHPVSLGPRILRADTAVVAALVLWQTALGDWR